MKKLIIIALLIACAGAYATTFRRFLAFLLCLPASRPCVLRGNEYILIVSSTAEGALRECLDGSCL